MNAVIDQHIALKELFVEGDDQLIPFQKRKQLKQTVVHLLRDRFIRRGSHDIYVVAFCHEMLKSFCSTRDGINNFPKAWKRRYFIYLLHRQTREGKSDISVGNFVARD